MVEMDQENRIVRLIDKPEYSVPTSMGAVGLYHFSDTSRLRSVAHEWTCDTDQTELQLSAVFDAYVRRGMPFRGHSVVGWHDLGSLEGYAATHVSDLNESGLNGRAIELELPSMAEIYLYYDIEPTVWRYLLRTLLEQLGASEHGDSSGVHRNEGLCRLERIAADLHLAGSLRVNGFSCPGLSSLIQSLSGPGTADHPPLFFGDIRCALRLGRFIFRAPVPADRLKVASALRASYHGGLDRLLHGLFSVKESSPHDFTITLWGENEQLVAVADEVMTEHGFQTRDLLCSEVRHLLHAVVAYEGRPQLQRALLLRALQLAARLPESLYAPAPAGIEQPS